MGIMDRTYFIRSLRESDFEDVVKLGNIVIGDNYLSTKELEGILKKSIKAGVNCSFVLSLNEGDGQERVIGFRLTCAPGQWIDSYPFKLSPEKWGFDPAKVAYMKSNILDKEFRGKGFGRMLLDKSIATTKRVSAEAALAHIWMNSPGNSAYKYFSRAGGKVIKEYPAYWAELHNIDAPCNHCGDICICPAAEMIIDYSTHKELEYV